jgi:hypothetical protein
MAPSSLSVKQYVLDLRFVQRYGLSQNFSAQFLLWSFQRAREDADTNFKAEAIQSGLWARIAARKILG